MEDYLCVFRSVIVWHNAAIILPNNDDKMLVITETKKGIRQINIAYFDGQFWHGMGSMSKVIAWAYMPNVNNLKKAGGTDGQA